eukprot:CAMPEP_0113954460 /NCGR_PEP_ID=MMETSP0011_2-20120614/562_1 /TAXON_ID=101924 /ORGANISM="Rhodosorus marinus" /LENGTH=380 /DNA_ID=CAMNT_0000963585 /DNA_START=2386 /DNA_END=3529 /DNA_ORIENTATION=- /assembly_acc=CAM_ASM_000156
MSGENLLLDAIAGFAVHVSRRVSDLNGAIESHRCKLLNNCTSSAAPKANIEFERPGNPFINFVSRLLVANAREPDQENTTYFAAADRIIAVGDVHGDLGALRNVLKLSKLIGSNDEWVGGGTVLVQVGDLLDRGDQERAAFELLLKLREDAKKHGGAVHILHGNHEIMNVSLDFRYVTPGGFVDFEPLADQANEKLGKLPPAISETIKGLPEFMRSRAWSLRPGGPFSNRISTNQLAIVIGDNVFVHGGLRPTHLAEPGALETMNSACRAWMQGRAEKPSSLKTGKSPVWMRNYSLGSPKIGSDECNTLQASLDLIPAKRMIVGHTPQQQGINAACAGKVWRIDTGMSAAYGGPPEALEITNGEYVCLLQKAGAQPILAH